jgi:hypothetical protein
VVDLVLELTALSRSLLHERSGAGGVNAEQRNGCQQEDGTHR